MSGRWFGCGWAEGGAVKPWRPSGMVRALLAEAGSLRAAVPEAPTLLSMLAAAGLTQAELARQLGISPRRLCNYILGSRRLPLAMAPKVAAALDVSTDAIARAMPGAPRVEPTAAAAAPYAMAEETEDEANARAASSAEPVPVPSQVTTEDRIADLIRAYARTRGCSESYAAKLTTGSGDTLDRIDRGVGLTLRRADRIVRKISALWPADLPWPADVPRPEPTKGDPR